MADIPFMALWKTSAASLLLVLAWGCGAPSPKVVQGRNTDVARQLNEQALQLMAKGKYGEAETALQRAIAADDLFPPARNNLGLLYYHTSRLYAAAREFDEARKLSPQSAEPRNNLGMVWEQAGRLDDAVEEYGRARQMQPDNAVYLGNLARAKVKRGDHDAETRRLLEDVWLKDPRADWQEWARMALFRLREPATRP